VAAVTHPGAKNKPNEDRFAVSAYHLSSADPTPVLLAVIADGVGGHRAGEVAAEMAVETISRLVAESDGSQPALLLSQAMAQASLHIFEQSHRDPAQVGMGTTCICVWIIGDRLYAASAGDSRLYLLRRGAIQRLTTDHTWVQEALDNGVLSPVEARSHPNVHVIHRYLGSKQPLRPDLRLRLSAGESDAQAEANQGLRLLPGDRLLLSSDGLTDLVEDGEILAHLNPTDEHATALQKLVDLANQRGGHDNITILSLEMPLEAAAVHLASTMVFRPSRRLGLPYLVAGGLIGIGLLLAVGLSWLLYRPGGWLRPGLTPHTSPALTQPVATTLLAETLPAGSTPPPTLTAIPPATLTPQPTALSVTYTPWPTNTHPP